MAFFEYQHCPTLLHRLHPLSKTLWIIGMGLVASIYFDPRPLVPLLLVTIPVVFISRAPWRSWVKPLGFVVVLSLFSFFVISLWLNKPGAYSRYPEWTTVTFLEIAGPTFPLGRMAVTLAGVAYALGQVLRSLTVVLTVAVFVHSTAPSDIVYLLDKVRCPSKLVFMVMAAYRFFPHIFRKLSVVIAAQRLRGWELNARNPINLALQYLPVTIPVMTEIVRISEYTTQAVESRAFGVARFTLHRELKFHLRDYLFAGFWLAVVALCVYLYIVYDVGKL